MEYEFLQSLNISSLCPLIISQNTRKRCVPSDKYELLHKKRHDQPQIFFFFFFFFFF